MKQIWITKAGPPEVLKSQDAPAPIPKNGEVRVRVKASGVNFADILGRMGIYPDAPRIPYVPGYEFSGVVESITQGVVGFKEGDRVFGLTRFGGYSDTICVPHKQIFKALDWMNDEDAAAIPVTYLAAYAMLRVMGSLQKNDKVLIHGAAGGVGLAAIDICRIVGAEVFGTASTEKHQFITERGCHYPIDYRRVDYAAAVMQMTNGKGVSLILDPFGGIHWRKNYQLLQPTGRIVHFGVSSLAPGKTRSIFEIIRGLISLPRYSPVQLMNDNKAVMGYNAGQLWDRMDLIGIWMEQLVTWYDEALFRPHIDKTFPFSEAAAAHHYIQDRKNIGKVLLIPD